MERRGGINVVVGLLHDHRLARQIGHKKAGAPVGNIAPGIVEHHRRRMALRRGTDKPPGLKGMGDDLGPYRRMSGSQQIAPQLTKHDIDVAGSAIAAGAL